MREVPGTDATMYRCDNGEWRFVLCSEANCVYSVRRDFETPVDCFRCKGKLKLLSLRFSDALIIRVASIMGNMFMTQQFLQAAHDGDLDQVNECIANGINKDAKNSRGATALHLAS